MRNGRVAEMEPSLPEAFEATGGNWRGDRRAANVPKALIEFLGVETVLTDRELPSWRENDERSAGDVNEP